MVFLLFFSTFSSPKEILNFVRQYLEPIKNLWFSCCFSTFSSPREILNFVRQYLEPIKNLWFSYVFFDIFLSQGNLKPHQTIS